jgi:hypothetical protein
MHANLDKYESEGVHIFKLADATCQEAARGTTSDVNGSDQIMLSPYPLPHFFGGFGAERIMTGCGFGCGLHRTTDSDRKRNGFGAETDKIYRIDTRTKTYFHHCKYMNKKFLKRITKSIK